MAYTVNKSDGEEILVQDGTVNTDTSLKLVGKNYIGYGEAIAENFVHLMENFAGGTAPDIAKSVVGQLFYNTSDDNFYYSRDVGSGNKEWKPLHLQTIKPFTVKDIYDIVHTVTAFYDEQEIVAIVSSADFQVNQDAGIYDEFQTIGHGITLRNGTSGAKFHGTASSAQYADLAEMYVADAEYAPGTVLKIGGEAEVTQTTEALCTQVFGIVSSEPAYLMNSTLCSEDDCIAVAVALAGRLSCRVIGPVKKGDRLVSSEEPGVARVASIHEAQDAGDWNRVIGRALADKTTESIDLVEIVVGAK